MEHARAFEAARTLSSARRSGERLESLPAELTPADQADGYQIQDLVVTCHGREVGAWKIGATHPNSQKVLGSDTPVAARLFSECLVSGDTTVEDRLVVRGLEAEYAFLLGGDLPPEGAPYSREEIEAAIASVHPSIEVVDTRFTGPQAGPMAIADNVNDCCWVYGAGVDDWKSVDILTARVTMEVNGEVVVEGDGREVLGDPINALMWLVNEHANSREGLRSGQYVTCGSCTGLYKAPAGCDARATFEGLGEVNVKFRS